MIVTRTTATLYLILILATTSIATAAVFDTLNTRKKINELELHVATQRAGSEIPFSASIVVRSADAETQGIVVSMFNTKIGQEAFFLGTLDNGAPINQYTPVVLNGTIIGLGKPSPMKIEDLTPGSAGMATMYYDESGALHIKRLTIGVGAWDR